MIMENKNKKDDGLVNVLTRKFNTFNTPFVLVDTGEEYRLGFIERNNHNFCHCDKIIEDFKADFIIKPPNEIMEATVQNFDMSLLPFEMFEGKILNSVDLDLLKKRYLIAERALSNTELVFNPRVEVKVPVFATRRKDTNIEIVYDTPRPICIKISNPSYLGLTSKEKYTFFGTLSVIVTFKEYISIDELNDAVESHESSLNVLKMVKETQF